MAALKISIDLQKRSANRSTIRAMPRQNTCPADFPPFILSQIEQVAQRIVATRKSRGETQAQWAQKLGISQPTMARIERGDPSIATATYVMCLWLVNPQLHLLQLLDAQTADTAPAPPLSQHQYRLPRPHNNPPWPTSLPNCCPRGRRLRCNCRLRQIRKPQEAVLTYIQDFRRAQSMHGYAHMPLIFRKLSP